MHNRILIAEDDDVTRELLTSIAKERGYDVSTVSNGFDLLTKLNFESFDVVITDIMMADLNGASAAEILIMQGNTTPVIALTAVSSGDMDLVKDKFNKVFHKPVNISELFNYVESVI